MSTPSTQSPQHVLNQLVTSLQCSLCRNHPPTNVHICPRCSALFCFRCITEWIRANRNRCASCGNGPLHANTLIKLRCLDTGADELGADLANLNLEGEVAGTSADVPCHMPTLVEEHRNETVPIGVGRMEPVAGLPPAVEGSFTVRNIHGCRLAWVCSEHVVDELGFKWRLRVNTRDRVNRYLLGVYVELLYGEEGFYEVMFELQNVLPVAYLVRDRIGHDAYVGVSDFLDVRSLPPGRFDLRFRYTIRPADFKAKVQIQQRLLNKRTSRTQRLKGIGDEFVYRIEHFSFTDLQDSNYGEYTDQFGSIWKVGVHGNHDFADFELVLIYGLAGIFHLEAELTHPENGCQKRVSFERNVQPKQRNFFNFHIRWGQLQEYGYDHGRDLVEVRIVVTPVQVDLKQVVDIVASRANGDDDSEDQDVASDYYYYSSSLSD